MSKTNRQFNPPGLRPEAELLLWSSRICEDRERTDRIKALLKEDINWDYIIHLAMHNRLLPLLFWQLKAASPESVPCSVMDRLRTFYRNNALLHMFLARELVELLAYFKEHGIQAMSYKGPLLGADVYWKMDLRQYGDIDILVHKDDIFKVKKLLLSRGYYPRRKLNAKQELDLIESEREYHFIKKEGKIEVDVHWHILPKPFSSIIDDGYFWERAVSVTYLNTTVLTLPPEEMFVFLCMHNGEKHRWTQLRWILDIALFLKKHKDLDWKKVRSEAKKFCLEDTISLGLYLAEVLLKASLPDMMSKWIHGDSRTFALAGLVRGRLFRNDFGLPGFNEWFCYIENQEKLSNLKSRFFYRRRYFLRYLQAVLKPELRDRFNMRALPHRLSFMCYFYRILRLTKAHKVNLIRRLQ